MNLSGFIDTFKESIARRVLESYPPLYRPSETPVQAAPKLLRKPMGGQEDAIKGDGPLIASPPGHHRRWRDGHGKNFHRRRRRPRRRLPAGVDTLCPPHLTRKWKREVEDTVPLRPGRHRRPPSPTWNGCGCPWVPHLSSPSCPEKGPSSPTDGSPPSSSAGLLPLGADWYGTSRPASPSRCPAAPPATPRSWTGTACP